MKKNKKKNRLCFICSSGGHFFELSFFKKLAKECDSFLVTEYTDKFKTDFCDNVFFISEINRKEKLFIFHLFLLFFKEFWIFITKRPDYVISTGALCSYPMLLIAHFFGKKVIYIESYARVNELSTTGKKVYKFADLFFVQWEELKLKYDKAIFIGSIFGELK